MTLNKNIHKVNILGTEYTVVFDSNSKNPKLEYKDGYVDTSVKKIVIRDYFERFNKLKTEKALEQEVKSVPTFKETVMKELMG